MTLTSVTHWTLFRLARGDFMLRRSAVARVRFASLGFSSPASADLRIPHFFCYPDDLASALRDSIHMVVVISLLSIGSICPFRFDAVWGHYPLFDCTSRGTLVWIL